MKISQQKRAELAKVAARNKALAATLTGDKADFTAEEQTEFDNNLKRAETLKTQIKAHEAQEALEAEAVAPQTRIIKEETGNVIVPEKGALVDLQGNVFKVPATVRANAALKVFKSREAAYKAGIFMAAVGGFQWARKRATNLFDMQALQSEGVNTDGGYSVPEEISAEMIDLREKKGIFRQKSRIIPMSRDTFSMGRRVSGLTGYFVDEGVAGTVSTKKMDRVGLTAKKVAVIATLTKELNEDAIISWVENLFQESAYALASLEDDCGFNGDGTSTYGGIVGLKNALQASCKVTQATGTTWGAIVAADIANLQSKQPDYDVPTENEFYCNKAFYFNVLRRIAQAAGGTTGEMMVNGIPYGMYDGYRVNFVSSMPRVTASAHIPLYFGDLRLASKFGDRAGLRMEMTDQGVVGGVELFTTDEIGLKTIERFDINIHERGTTTSSDAGGPINALVTG